MQLMPYMQETLAILTSSRYPKSHMMKIIALDGLIFLCGILCLAVPVIHHFHPSSIDTTSHVAVGALICVLSIFRVTLAYGGLWMEIPLFFLGLITFSFPRIMHMQWDHSYNYPHMIVGGAVMALSVISLLITLPALKKKQS